MSGAHELVPYGYKDKLDDRYFNITLDGFIRSCSGSGSFVSVPTYYSLDGTFLRLEASSYADWTLYFPDGSKVEDGTRLFDRNGNYVDMASAAVSDQLGRDVTITGDNGDTLVTSQGVAGEDIVWRIEWKTIYVVKSYTACTHHVCPDDDFPLEDYRDYLLASFDVVDKVHQPGQLGGGTYTFTYNGTDTLPDAPYELTDGWGELSGIELPSGATVTYDYSMDGEDGPAMLENTKDILKNHVTTKTVHYDLEYDLDEDPPQAEEIWTYSVGTEGTSVGAPDGSSTTTDFGTTQPDSSGGLPWNTGLTLRTTSPDGTKVENIWERNIPETCTSTWGTCASVDNADNPYVKTTFTSIKDASSRYTLTAIKDFTYDKNGNVTEVREYDYVPYSTVPRTNGYPTGLPSGASSYLKRITKTAYYNDVPEASSTSYGDGDTYIFGSSERLLRLAKSIDIQNPSEVTKSRAEITYDYTNYDSSNTKAGNPTVTRQWDSTKNSVSNPLTDGNSIKTQ